MYNTLTYPKSSNCRTCLLDNDGSCELFTKSLAKNLANPVALLLAAACRAVSPLISCDVRQSSTLKVTQLL